MLWVFSGIESGHEAIAISRELRGASDRASAIACAAFLDARLEAAIRATLIDDEKGELLDRLLLEGAPIGSFVTRIRVGFALGIYGPETRRDLEYVAKIRNKFAHIIAIKSLEEAPISDWCRNLKLIDRYISDRETPEDQMKWVNGLTAKVEGRDAWMAQAGERYFATTGLISTALHPAVMQERDHSQALADSATGLP